MICRSSNSKINASNAIRLRPFTFIEVMVASCIIGIALGVILTGFSINMKNAAIANDYITAIQLAEVKFNELLLERKLKAGESSGDFGRDFPSCSWHAVVLTTADGSGMNIQVEVSFESRGVRRTYAINSIRPIEKVTKDKEKKSKKVE